MTKLNIKYFLSDLDGVIRHYPAERDREIEKKLSLPPKALSSTAFEKTLLSKAVCGTISDETWRAEMIVALSRIHPPDVAVRAVKEWSDFSGVVDYEYLKAIESCFPGMPVVLLTNGTSRLKKDLIALGIEGRFSKIFNSAEIGVCKPEKEIFKHVIENLGCKASEIFFVDDSIAHVQAAQEMGMVTHHYLSLQGFQDYCQQVTGQPSAASHSFDF